MYLSSVPASKLRAAGHICAVIQYQAVPGDKMPILSAYLHNHTISHMLIKNYISQFTCD